MANRTGPIIVQLVITYIVVAFIVRAIRQARKKSAPNAPRPTQDTSPHTPEEPGDELEVSSDTREVSGIERPSPAPRLGVLRREELHFNGVVWHLTFRPQRDLSEGATSRVLTHEIYVEEPPRCPKCQLGVVESRSWLGYTWSCPGCGTRKRSDKSIQAVAELLAHRH